MFIDHENKLILVTPMKCATHTFREIAGRLGSSLQLTPVYPHVMVCDGDEGYRRVMAVRDPYDRLVSIYLHLQSRPLRWIPEGLIQSFTFKKFMPWWCLQQSRAEGNFWSMSLTDCANMFYPTRLVRVEHLAEDLAALGVVVDGDIPHMNRASNRQGDSLSYYSDEMLHLAYDWFAKYDCDLISQLTKN